MLIHTKTHRGLVRASNQDTLLVAAKAYGVADGMGGHNGGETASRVAVQVLTNALKGKAPQEQALRTAVQAANRRVFEMGSRDAKLSGMGTTVTLLWEGAREMLIAHVGDSRAYLYRDKELVRQTEDHSMVAELVKNKVITPEMAANHPYRSVITRALGIDPMVTPDVIRVEKKLEDIWLVCSDGLYNMVPDDQIAEALGALSLERAAEKLLELAIDHGGQDNISFVLGRVTEVEAP
ncbi:MAG: Stp1/IreP family PP2C-type Ser/Thr phosphatase [Candidatus Limiplasma sp.]|nr:Stp1/IreP family PP2C-type Ser/Thr phosphatase [Candidatus Limiplasma sp.]